MATHQGQKLTDWFNGKTDPARHGVYEVEWCIGMPTFAKFDGNSVNGWRVGNSYSIREASRNTLTARSKPLRWRGLAQDPKAAA